MNPIIICYSMTGRNRRLSEMVSQKLGMELAEIKETKNRKVMTVAWDLMLKRTPKTEPGSEILDNYDMIILFAPVWMGAAATPLRGFFKRIKKQGKPYGFISLSGGAQEKNSNLKKDTLQVGGKNLKLILDMHVSDVIDGEPTREKLQNYKLSDEQYEMFADRAVEEIKKALGM